MAGPLISSKHRRARGGLTSARRCAAVAVQTVFSVGAWSQRGPIGGPGGTDAQAERPRTWAGLEVRHSGPGGPSGTFANPDHERLPFPYENTPVGAYMKYCTQ